MQNDPAIDHLKHVVTRRQLLRKGSAGIGSMALGSLMAPQAFAEHLKHQATHLVPKAKRIIFLFMNGAPSQ